MMKRTVLLIVALLAPCLTAAARDEPTQPTVAVVSEAGDAASAAAIRARLSKRLAEHEHLQLVNREHIDAVLKEHERSRAGLIQRPIEGGKLVGAEYLVYIASAGSSPTFANTKVSLILVQTATGNVLVERAWHIQNHPEQNMAPRARAASDLVKGRITKAERSGDQSAATVLSILDRNESDRLRFLRGSLRSTIEQILAEAGWRVLRRRHLDIVSKETRLNTVGLVRPNTRVLASAARLTVSAKYRERLASDKLFSKTPIELALTFREQGQERSKQFTFTLDTIDQLQGKLRSAVPDRAPAAATTDKPATSSAKLEAARLLARIERPRPYPGNLKDFEHRAELCRRIIYLDPTAKAAYYHLGMALYVLCDRGSGKPITEKRRPIFEACREAFVRYLQFPRSNHERVADAFSFLQVGAMEGLIELAYDDPRELTRLCKQALDYGTEYTRWCAKTDWSNEEETYVGTELPSLTSTFGTWFSRRPERKASFFDWVVTRLVENESISIRDLDSWLLKAAHALDEAGKQRRAAERFYQAIVAIEPSRRRLRAIEGAYPQYVSSDTVDDYTSIVSEARVRRLREAMDNMHEEVTPMTAMYGDFFGDAEDTYDLAYHGDRLRLSQQNHARAEPEAIEGPPGQIWTSELFKTGDMLWVLTCMREKSTDDQFADALFRLTLTDSGTATRWERIALPDAMTESWPAGPMGARAIRSMVQAGNEFLWYGGRIRGGEVTPFDRQAKPLIIREADTGRVRTFGVGDGLPKPTVTGLYPSADGNAAWVTTAGGFLARYEDGRIHLTRQAGKKLTEWAFSRSASFAKGEGAIWRGDGRGQDMRKVVSRKQLNRLIPGPVFFKQPRSRGSGRGPRRSVIVDDRAYLIIQHGLLVMDRSGDIKRFWYPTSFCRFSELGGFVEGNCPLPSMNLRHVWHDRQDPNRLWIVSRDRNMYPTPRERPSQRLLKKHGLKPTGGSDPIYRNREIAKLNQLRGMYITAFNIKTQKWSEPVFVPDVVDAVPHGDYWYFTGIEFARVPKSKWQCDQPATPDARPAFHTADTLHGKASAALYRKDFDRARELLNQAIAKNIAKRQSRTILRKVKKIQERWRQQ